MVEGGAVLDRQPLLVFGREFVGGPDSLRIPITSNTLRSPSGIGRRKPAAGNGIFRCSDGELKIGLRDCKCLQRPKKPNQAVEYPRRNGLFPIEDGFDGFGRLVERL